MGSRHFGSWNLAAWKLVPGSLEVDMRHTLIALALLTLSCSAAPPGPPDIVVDRTACSHCGMLISETIYAAASQAPGSDGRVFDDIGCLIQASRKDTSTGLRFWFHDASDGGWIEGDAASFVVSPDIRTPMGGGILAYRDMAAAAQAAGTHRGEIVRSLPDLMIRKGEQ